MIFSRGEAIPRGLIFPFRLGIMTLLEGLNLKCSLRSWREVRSNHFKDIPSRVSFPLPGTMFPDLDLIVSYASRRMYGSEAVRKAFIHLPCLSNLRRLRISTIGFSFRSASSGSGFTYEETEVTRARGAG